MLAGRRWWYSINWNLRKLHLVWDFKLESKNARVKTINPNFELSERGSGWALIAAFTALHPRIFAPFFRRSNVLLKFRRLFFYYFELRNSERWSLPVACWACMNYDVKSSWCIWRTPVERLRALNWILYRKTVPLEPFHLVTSSARTHRRSCSTLFHFVWWPNCRNWSNQNPFDQHIRTTSCIDDSLIQDKPQLVTACRTAF